MYQFLLKNLIRNWQVISDILSYTLANKKMCKSKPNTIERTLNNLNKGNISYGKKGNDYNFRNQHLNRENTTNPNHQGKFSTQGNHLNLFNQIGVLNMRIKIKQCDNYVTRLVTWPKLIVLSPFFHLNHRLIPQPTTPIAFVGTWTRALCTI